MNVVNGLAGQALEIGQAELGVGVGDIDQVMGHTGAFLAGGFGSADVQASVHQGRIHADDLDREMVGQSQR